MISFEMNLRKEKWLFVSIYNPQLQSNQYVLVTLGDLVDFYSHDYENKVILGDFNLQGVPQKCPYFSLAITFIKTRKPSRSFLHGY